MSMPALEKFEKSQMNNLRPEFRPGDTIRVNLRVVEGDRERIQAFEGVCIRVCGKGLAEMVTVRKISSGIGVERTFFLHSPLIESIHVQRKGHVRRARLYYLRSRFGKRARVRGSKKFLARVKQEPTVVEAPEEAVEAEGPEEGAQES